MAENDFYSLDRAKNVTVYLKYDVLCFKWLCRVFLFQFLEKEG